MSNEYPNPTNPAPIHGKVDHYDCDMETGTISYHVVKTNGDVFRSLSDEDIAKTLNSAGICPSWVKWTKWECPNIECHECWIKWLKEEVNE